MAATAAMCRVSIRTADQEADLTLPAHIPTGELLPAVVDFFDDVGLGGAEAQLTRVCGERLDPAATLAECGIPDGEMLILASVPRPVPVIRHDPSTVVADAARDTEPSARWLTGRNAARLLLGWATSALAAVLGHAALHSDAGRQPVISGTAAVLAIGAAVVANRTRSAGADAVGLGLLAVGFAGLTATQLAVDQPGMSAFLLAMAASSSASLLAWRLLRCASMVFLPLAAATMMAVAVAIGAVTGWWPAAVVGPVLSTAALGVLAVSPRLSVLGSGLTAADLPEELLTARAGIARRRLTAIAVAAGWATALGAVLTAFTTSHSASAGVFLTITGAALLLRAIRLRDPYGMGALSVSSVVVATALVGLCAVEAPPSTPWLCGVLLAIAVGATRFGRGVRLSATGRHVLSVLDPVLSAAVVPTACGAAGLFAGLGLPW